MWRDVGLLLSLGTGLATGFYAPRARAEPPGPPPLRVSLEYDAEPGLDCPSESDFRARVARQLGYAVFVEPGAGQRLRIQISRAGERAQARIEWFDRAQNSEGERQLTSSAPGCADLARSLAFAVAVQIQLHASAAAPDEPASSPPPEPVAPPPPSPRAEPKPTPTPPLERGTKRAWFIGSGVLVRTGFSPGVGVGARAFGAVAIDSALLELSGHVTGPSRSRQADGSGFSAYELGASLAPCLRVAPLGLCVVGSASFLQVRGEGVDVARSPSSLLASAGGRLQLLWPRLGRVGVLVAGEVVAILTPRDVFLNESKVWSTAPVAVTLSLNIAGIFE